MQDPRVIELLEEILQELRKDKSISTWPPNQQTEITWPAHICDVPTHLYIPPGNYWQCPVCGKRVYGFGPTL